MPKAKKISSISKVLGDRPKSDALKTLEASLDHITAFIERLRSDEVLRTTKALERTLLQVAAAAPKININRIQRKADAFQAAFDSWIAFYVPACRWMTVMLVSFVETYLEDGLVGIAVKNPRVIKNVEIQTSQLFEVATIEELRGHLRSNWAHTGGPATWHKKLRELGAPPFDQKALYKVQHLWDTRNLIVHSRCVASIAYAKTYAHIGIKQGAEVTINLKTFGAWLTPIKEFVEWADNFFIKYGEKVTTNKQQQ